jgi:hypothetical protein
MQWIQIIFYGVLLMLFHLLWNAGLKYFGPLRTIIGSDHGDILLGAILATVVTPAAAHSNKVHSRIATITNAVCR